MYEKGIFFEIISKTSRLSIKEIEKILNNN